MIPITLDDGRSYILLMKLNNNSKSLLFLNENNEKSDEYSESMSHQIIKIIETKIHNIMIVLTKKKLFLVRLVLALDCLQ